MNRGTIIAGTSAWRAPSDETVMFCSELGGTGLVGGLDCFSRSTGLLVSRSLLITQEDSEKIHEK